jgi:hypothetical protein
MLLISADFTKIKLNEKETIEKILRNFENSNKNINSCNSFGFIDTTTSSLKLKYDLKNEELLELLSKDYSKSSKIVFSKQEQQPLVFQISIGLISCQILLGLNTRFTSSFEKSYQVYCSKLDTLDIELKGGIQLNEKNLKKGLQYLSNNLTLSNVRNLNLILKDFKKLDSSQIELIFLHLFNKINNLAVF